MKKFLYALAGVSISLASYAQPVLSSIEDFAAGDKYEMVNCSDTGLSAGPAGANQTWKFTTLKPKDTSTTFIITASSAPDGSKYPKASLAIKQKGGIYTYVTKDAAMSSLWMGIADSVVGLRYEYMDSALFLKRPMQYQTTFGDEFPSTLYVLGSPLPYIGGGFISVTADGWGSLQIGNRTYNNVLRIKVELQETDSNTMPVLTKFTTQSTTYLWYISGIKNPLLTINKSIVKRTSGISTIQIPKQYVAYYYDKTTGLDNTIAKAIEAKARFSGNDLWLEGSFEEYAKYDLAIRNINGATVYTGSFTGNSNAIHFDMKDMQAGIYMVQLVKTTGAIAELPKTVKVYKQ